MKKVLLVVLGLLLVLVLASPLLLKALFPEPKLRALLLPRAEAALGRTVDCAHLGIALGLRGVSVELEQLELGPVGVNPGGSCSRVAGSPKSM